MTVPLDRRILDLYGISEQEAWELLQRLPLSSSQLDALRRVAQGDWKDYFATGFVSAPYALLDMVLGAASTAKRAIGGEESFPGIDEARDWVRRQLEETRTERGTQFRGTGPEQIAEIVGSFSNPAAGMGFGSLARLGFGVMSKVPAVARLTGAATRASPILGKVAEQVVGGAPLTAMQLAAYPEDIDPVRTAILNTGIDALSGVALGSIGRRLQAERAKQAQLPEVRVEKPEVIPFPQTAPVVSQQELAQTKARVTERALAIAEQKKLEEQAMQWWLDQDPQRNRKLWNDLPANQKEVIYGVYLEQARDLFPTLHGTRSKAVKRELSKAFTAAKQLWLANNNGDIEQWQALPREHKASLTARYILAYGSPESFPNIHKVLPTWLYTNSAEVQAFRAALENPDPDNLERFSTVAEQINRSLQGVGLDPAQPLKTGQHEIQKRILELDEAAKIEPSPTVIDVVERPLEALDLALANDTDIIALRKILDEAVAKTVPERVKLLPIDIEGLAAALRLGKLPDKVPTLLGSSATRQILSELPTGTVEDYKKSFQTFLDFTKMLHSSDDLIARRAIMESILTNEELRDHIRAQEYVRRYSDTQGFGELLSRWLSGSREGQKLASRGKLVPVGEGKWLGPAATPATSELFSSQRAGLGQVPGVPEIPRDLIEGARRLYYDRSREQLAIRLDDWWPRTIPKATPAELLNPKKARELLKLVESAARRVKDPAELYKLDGLRITLQRTLDYPIDLREREIGQTLLPSVFPGYLTITSNDSDDDENLARKVVLGATVAGAIGLGVFLRRTFHPRRLGKLHGPNTPPLPPDNPPIIYTTEIKGLKLNPRAAAYEAYRQAVRSIYPVEAAVERIVGKDRLPTHKDPYKAISIVGSSATRVEAWSKLQPSLIRIDGAVQPLDALPLFKIMELAGGDLRDFNEYLVSLMSLELHHRGKPAPRDLDYALAVVRGAPASFAKAGEEFRKYHEALIRVLVEEVQQITPSEADRVIKSATWYAPLQRLIEEGGLRFEAIEESVPRGPQALYKAKPTGKGHPILAPLEVTMEMTARVMRQAELHRTFRAYKDFVTTYFPDEMRRYWLAREDEKLPSHDELLRAVQAEPQKEALFSLIADFPMLHDPVSKRYKLRVFEGGETRVYTVPREFRDAILSLRPKEQDFVLSMLAKPTRLTAKMIVTWPVFALIQFLHDGISAAFTYKKFHPFVTSLKGLTAIWKNTPEVQQMMAAGGWGSIASLRYVPEKFWEGGEFSPKAITGVTIQGKTRAQYLKEVIKEMDFKEAWTTIFEPFLDAARVGAGLEALGHGASVLDAVWQAHNVIGNVRMQGSSPLIQKLNFTALFARPALATLDELVAQMGIHPIRRPSDVQTAVRAWMVGLSAVTIPAMALWYWYKDDEELRMYRQVQGLSNKLLFRNPLNEKQIIAMRLPPVIGELFAAVPVEILDRLYYKDPQGVTTAMQDLFDDMAPQVMPHLASIVLSYVTNRRMGLGGPVIPARSEDVEAQLAGKERANYLSKVASDFLARVTGWTDTKTVTGRLVSPVGIEYLVTSLFGYVGQDALKASTWINRYLRDNLPPPASDLPLVGRFVMDEQSLNVGPVKLFYERAQKVEQYVRTYEEYVHKGELKLAHGLFRRSLVLASAVPFFGQAREDIATRLRAISDIELMKDIPESTRRPTIDLLRKEIITIAKTANTAYTLLERHIKEVQEEERKRKRAK